MSPLVDEGRAVRPLRAVEEDDAGIQIISLSHSKELQVPVHLASEGVVGVGGLEVLSVLLAGDAEVIGGHGGLAEVRRGLERRKDCSPGSDAGTKVTRGTDGRTS